MATIAQTLYRDLMPLESEVAAVCEMLVKLGRCGQKLTHWGQPWFVFEDGSYIVIGMLGPYVGTI